MMTMFNAMVLFASFAGLVSSIEQPQIVCLPSLLEIFVPAAGVSKVGLEKWSSMPGCEAEYSPDGYRINLKLNPDLPCGTTRVKNKLTGDTVFYHKIFIRDSEGGRRVFKVSCFIPYGEENSNRIKRNVLPAEFVEPDYIEITQEVSGAAPIPELGIGVRQNGQLIGDHVTVSPGAPLIMEVYLDSASASTYGLLVSYLMVSDTSNKNETIIYNGCAQDAYIFENFDTRKGDFLTAKFRAFKFPESNFLMFRGTVDVCLDKCQGVRCNNGEIGYGRKRRAIPEDRPDSNKIYEVTMMTFIKVEDKEIIEEAAAVEYTEKEHQQRPIHTHSDSSLQFFRRSPVTDDPPFTYFESKASMTLSAHTVWLGLFLAIARFFI